MIPRTIFVYLYRLNGRPQYVGQTHHLAYRDAEHLRGSTPFDKFLKSVGRDKFMLEVVGSCRDIPRGPKINKLENQMMDKYRTFQPESEHGWNFGRAEQFGDRTLRGHKVWKDASKAATLRHALRIARVRKRYELGLCSSIAGGGHECRRQRTRGSTKCKACGKRDEAYNCTGAVCKSELRIKIRPGDQFANRRVLERAGLLHGHSCWRVQCVECGVTARVQSGNLRRTKCDHRLQPPKM